MAKRFYLVCSAVVFNSENHVLLIRRHQPNYAFGHNKWLLPGGSLEFGEDPKDGVQRELLEEAGLRGVHIATHPAVHSWVSDDYKEHVIILAFPMKYESGEITVENDDETADAAWVDLDRVNDLNCFPLTEEIIEEARKQAQSDKVS